MTVRLLLWNLFDSRTTLDELRQHLRDLIGKDPEFAEEFDLE